MMMIVNIIFDVNEQHFILGVHAIYIIDTIRWNISVVVIQELVAIQAMIFVRTILSVAMEYASVRINSFQIEIKDAVRRRSMLVSTKNLDHFQWILVQIKDQLQHEFVIQAIVDDSSIVNEGNYHHLSLKKLKISLIYSFRVKSECLDGTIFNFRTQLCDYPQNVFDCR